MSHTGWAYWRKSTLGYNCRKRSSRFGNIFIIELNQLICLLINTQKLFHVEPQNWTAQWSLEVCDELVPVEPQYWTDHWFVGIWSETSPCGTSVLGRQMVCGNRSETIPCGTSVLGRQMVCGNMLWNISLWNLSTRLTNGLWNCALKLVLGKP